MADEHSEGPQPQPRSVSAASDKNRAWPVHIDVYLKSDVPSDKPDFEIKTSLPSYKSSKGKNVLLFENNHRPGFKIHFHLHDGTGHQYVFARDADDAVWSKIGEDNCPKAEAHEVFEPISTGDDPHTGLPMLVVYNENDKKAGAPIGKFCYTLRVTKDNGANYLNLDPIGDDQNGSRTFGFR